LVNSVIVGLADDDRFCVAQLFVMNASARGTDCSNVSDPTGECWTNPTKKSEIAMAEMRSG
jgi:hypothetical protein